MRRSLLPVFRQNAPHKGNERNNSIATDQKSDECRRFCVGQSLKAQQRATTCQGEASTHSITISCSLQNSIEFNKRWNLVRDQGVGGSNPLSPTNLFKPLFRRNQRHLHRRPPLQKTQGWGTLTENGAGRNRERWATRQASFVRGTVTLTDYSFRQPGYDPLLPLDNQGLLQDSHVRRFSCY